MAKIYLITGNCGVGKTHVMKSVMRLLNITPIHQYKTGLYQYIKKNGVLLLGKYDGSVFEGSDKLSMSIMKDNDKIAPIFDEVDTVIGEGDRFTNSTFIKRFNPIILRINGDGKFGRDKRGSTQSERQIKSIATRVRNIPAHKEFENSRECAEYLITEILKKNVHE